MQFKYPEILWALFLLLIPIIIHLFQLRRFKKTPFTNVQLLQKVISESRKSNTLKKWLLLITRMLLFTAIIMAFAQPFFASQTALKEKETVVYLDNSFSMQAKSNNETLLTNAVQELIKEIPDNTTFSLFTNTHVFKDVMLKDIQNDLLGISFTQQQLTSNEIRLKAETLFENGENTIKNLVLVSDFQQRLGISDANTSLSTNVHLVQLQAEANENISIDSVFVQKTIAGTKELTAKLRSNSTVESIPVSLFNGTKLIAKTAAVFKDDSSSEVVFSIPDNDIIEGRIEISDNSLTYDNELYFNIDQKEKINVLGIHQEDNAFLSRIFTSDEFNLSNYTLKNLNYSVLESQNLLILNGLQSFPNALQTSLQSFKANGGSILIIPSLDIQQNTYNGLLSNYRATSIGALVRSERQITNIAFNHPLYLNVFEKEVTNFQYPKVSNYYKIRSGLSNVLSFENQDAFLIGGDGIYIFSSSLDGENSNFKNSPLIVPTLYNIGVQSLQLPQLYHKLQSSIAVDIPISLEKDHILRLVQPNYEFIPQQRSFAKKVTLRFNENPSQAGIYSVMDKEVALKNMSFNYTREESVLNYMNLDNLVGTSKQTSISALFQNMENDNRISKLWKWFVILALLFIVVEVLIQKYFK